MDDILMRLKNRYSNVKTELKEYGVKMWPAFQWPRTEFSDGQF